MSRRPIRGGLVALVAAGATLLAAPAAHAHSVAAAHDEERASRLVPERARAVPRGATERRAAAATPPAASYAFTAPAPTPAKGVTADGLHAGVGRSDVTPPRTGYFLGGWTRADRLGHGVSTRLTTSAMTLRRGDRRIALVAFAGFAVPQGLLQGVASQLRDLGLNERSIVVSATHTHSAAGGFSPSETLNTAAPGMDMILADPTTVADLVTPAPADPQLYGFLVRQIALAIRRAVAAEGPAVAGWGHTTLKGLTRNRSLPARANDLGLDPSKVPYGRTINPNVDVLRVDRLVGPRCAGEVRRAGSRASRAERRARTLRRRATRMRRAAAGARGQAHLVADRGARTARRRATRQKRTATRLRRSARRWARYACAKDGRLPLGAWTSFANHGTVVKSEFEHYSADHGGVAALHLEERIRRAADVPDDQPVISVYGSADQGDQSAGLEFDGPAGADLVGRTEGEAMFTAWRRAEPELRPDPELDLRWTRFCFCGRATSDGGRVADKPIIGLPFITGSEEGRGPLYDALGVSLEGLRLPDLDPVHGGKVQVPIGSWSEAWPMALVRVGDGAIITVPGEPTMGMGERLRASVLERTGAIGVRRAVVAGLANDYLNYVTTPKEFDAQQYEGGSTVFGRHSGVFLVDRARDLGNALAGTGGPLEQRDYDATNGLKPDAPGYGGGAASGRIVQQPGAVDRLERAELTWDGGASGSDMPVDRAFLIAERRNDDGTWTAVANDLGTSFAWRAEGSRYRARWEPPVNAPIGTYRIVVTASRYRLVSSAFTVSRSAALQVREVAAPEGRRAVRVGFALPRENIDLTARPTLAQRATVELAVDGRTVTARTGDDGVATIDAPAGSTVTVAAGGARDVDGNDNGRAVRLGGGR
ncbi:MAG: neutral/alkaline non-lysosomal ceramidase N-terminal domain-containing protein [Solirubrobacteraceae bacterium]